MLALEIGIDQAERPFRLPRGEELSRHSPRTRIMQGGSDSSSRGMDKILVHGGHPLSGSIRISGSKNSALPILAATLLTREPCVLHRVPDLSDTNYMLQILTHLGADVERASGTVTVKAEKVKSSRALRNRAENAGVGLRARSVVRPMQRGDRLAARRLRHRRSPDRSASQGIRSARRGGPGRERQRQSVRAETDRRGG